VIRKPHSEENL